jgi:hypothetical protein
VGEHLDQTRDLREAHDLAVRDVRHVDPAEEGQHMMLAQAVEVGVLDEDHLVVADVEEGVVEDVDRILFVALRQEAHGLGVAMRGAGEAVPGGILAQLLQDGFDVALEGVARVGQSGAPEGRRGR